jgi:hypothetical protein
MNYGESNMVVYEYGRNDFEDDLDTYSGGTENSVTDEEWGVIQKELSDQISDHVDELIRSSVYGLIFLRQKTKAVTK